VDQISEHGRTSVVPMIVTDSTFQKAVGRIAARADSIRQLLSTPQGTLGRFQKDSTLILEMRKTLATADSLGAQISSRLTLSTERNAALRQELRQVRTQLDSLLKDVKRNPFRYFTN